MKKPLKLSITGIDGVGKDSIARAVLLRLSTEHHLRSIKLGRPAYWVENGEVTPAYQDIIGPIDRRHREADGKNDPHTIVGTGLLLFLTQARLLEPEICEQADPPDILLSSRDPRLDTVTYLTYYGREFAERTTALERFDIIQAITGLRRDAVIYLMVEPARAMQRMHQRLAHEAEIRQKTGAASATLRDKWLHPHEDEANLKKLADEFELALAALKKRSPQTPIVRIDTNHRNLEQVCEAVYQTILAARAGQLPTGETER